MKTMHVLTAVLLLVVADSIAAEAAPATSGALALDAKAMKEAGIVVDTLGRRRLGEELKAPGEVKMDAYATVLVSPRVASQVVTRKARLGDVVTKGQPLVVLSSVEVAE